MNRDGAMGGAMQRLAVVGSLALVVLAVLAALLLMQGINQQINDMARTYDVRNVARELTLALSDEESSQLGYVLTGDANYLPMYDRAANAVTARMDSLKAATATDPVQTERVGRIIDDIELRVVELERAMDLVTAQRPAEARAMIRTGLDERTMDPVRSALELFIADENRKLLDRNISIDQARRWLVGAIVAALAGAVVLGGMLFMRAQQEVRVLARNRSLLQNENDVLETRVQERTHALEEARTHAERERQRVEALLQDTSHRIGNSLATVSSLLGLQLLRSKSDEVKRALESARSRVHSIASSHRRLRLGDDMETSSADEFLEAVLQDLATTTSSAQDISIIGEVDAIVISARDATTIGILVGELVTNALKHGFPDNRSGHIIVRLKRDGAGVPTLCVIDDGVGVDPHIQLGEGGLGSVIVKQLALQFGGVPEYARRVEGGLAVTVPLPGIERGPVSA